MQLRPRIRLFASSPLRVILTMGILSTFTGCRNVRDLTVTVMQGKYVIGKTDPTVAPVSGAQISGVWHNDISNSYQEGGSVYTFQGLTDNTGTFTELNLRMPAEWDVTWHNNPTYCVDQGDITQYYSVPWETPEDFEPERTSYNEVSFNCYSNDPTHPGFTATNVSPQFVLDDAVPASLWVASLDQIPSGGTTTLNVYDTSLNNVATMTASSISGNGIGATFPYPTGVSAALPSGAYITTITNQIGSNPITTHGMEPFYIAHDDTSYTGAFAVAVASPQEVTTVISQSRGSHNVCFPGNSTSTTVGGTPLPLVTLVNQGELAVGSMSNLMAVGTDPTVVLAFNDSPQAIDSGGTGCSPIVERFYSGAQSALVVNTGSNNVSILQIGAYQYPHGTVAVGNQPVAAAINSAETFAYIANYQDGTISEVNLQTLTQTRVLSVMTNPTSVTFDSSGNLWVGGQGSVEEINLSNWSVGATYPVDGTVNGMSYDVASGVLVQSILQNGSASNPSNGATGHALISYSTSTQQSYTTQNTFNVSTGASTVSTQFIGDNAAYSQSSISSLLAFPAQSAITPPIYSSTNGDMTATVSGTSFTVSVVGTGQVLIQGTLPYPARGVALTNTMLYFTMPESNSLVSLPIPTL